MQNTIVILDSDQSRFFHKLESENRNISIISDRIQYPDVSKNSKLQGIEKIIA